MALVHFAHDLLSPAELSAARLDGELVAIGDGYTAADGLETAAVRAASLRPILGTRLVAIGLSAAWVHGARGLPPAVHHIQRGADGVSRPVRHDIRFRDTPIAEADTVVLGGVRVATPARTLVELARESADPAAARAARRLTTPVLSEEATAWLRAHLRFPGRQRALAFLADMASDDPASQDDVTR